MSLKIRLKQRWQYKTGETSFIVEVKRHAYATCPYADLTVRQIIKLDGSGWNHLTKGYVIPAQYLHYDRWTLLEGQDRP